MGVVMLLAADSWADAKATSPTIDELERKIDALEIRIDRLESQLSGVQQAGGVAPRAATPSMPAPQLIEVPTLSDDARIPQNWKRSEINGIPFYTLPLSNRSDTGE